MSNTDFILFPMISSEQQKITVLLIEDDSAVTDLIPEILSREREVQFDTVCADRLQAGLETLAQRKIDIILLDLSLPDSQGLETFAKLRDQMLNIPLIILTGLGDRNLAIRTIQEGAQDYLIKIELENHLLVRSIRYALERFQLQQELFSMSLTDELTTLYNRRGFFVLAEQQLKQAKRFKRPMSLLFVDVDRLKSINDAYGHREGDRILIQAANVLKTTFRVSDIIARMGGDEFAILLVEGVPMSVSQITARLQKKINDLKNPENSHAQLSLSVGISCFDF